MPKRRPRDLAGVADALRKKRLSDEEYERIVNKMLGMTPEPRDREAEARWERRRRQKTSEPNS